MGEQPKPERTSAMSAGSRRMRSVLASARRSAQLTLGRIRGTKPSDDVVDQPTPESRSVDVGPIGAEPVDAPTSARRLLFRHWRLILAIAVILLQGLLAWIGLRLRERGQERRPER
jgi:hypothetical protein